MSQQEESLPPMSPKRLAIIGGVIAVIIIVIIVITSTSAGKPSVDSASGKLETATAAAIKAQVDLNRVEQGSYAYSYENLIEEANEEDKARLEKYRSTLKDFRYTVRGDSRAYQIKYTNIAGEEIIVSGNYSEDYH